MMDINSRQRRQAGWLVQVTIINGINSSHLNPPPSPIITFGAIYINFLCGLFSLSPKLTDLPAIQQEHLILTDPQQVRVLKTAGKTLNTEVSVGGYLTSDHD